MTRHIRTSDTISGVLTMPERNRTERRRKARACRAIVRSGYFRKHGVFANAASALQTCEASTYTERLREIAWLYAERLYKDAAPGPQRVEIALARLQAAKYIRTGAAGPL